MSIVIVVLAVLLAPMILVGALNLLAAPRLHRVPARRQGPQVSVLVPARDEAPNLRRLLPALLATEYEPLELVILDDGSADETAAVVRAFAVGDPRIRLLEGSEPPPGWTGKNWACHQLAVHASGDLIIFCDADMRPGPGAVGRTVAALERSGAQALTAIPRHEPGGRFEDAVIPLITTVPVAALLPLPLVSRTRTVSLSVGNGQWFAWQAAAYRRLGGHARVRSDVIEDVRLARLAKTAGYRLAAFVAPRDLTVRMYEGSASTREGFSKNLYPLLGGRPWTLAVALAFLVAAGLGPIVVAVAAVGSELWAVALLPLAALLAIRLMAATLVGDKPTIVALHPGGVIAVAALAVESWRRHRRGTVAWKRRTLAHEEKA